MIIVKLPQKECMAHLLLKPTFDDFSFIKAEITTFNTFEIDGFLHQDFFDSPKEESFSKWSDIRNFCLNMIRGDRTPLSFKIVLALQNSHLAAFLSSQNIHSFTPGDIQGLYINFIYDGQTLSCTSGTSLSLFSLDKSLEQAWDEFVLQFFKTQQIPFEFPQP